MLAVEGNQVKIEGGSPFILGVFESNLKVGSILVSLKGDCVIVIS